MFMRLGCKYDAIWMAKLSFQQMCASWFLSCDSCWFGSAGLQMAVLLFLWPLCRPGVRNLLCHVNNRNTVFIVTPVLHNQNDEVFLPPVICL